MELQYPGPKQPYFHLIVAWLRPFARRVFPRPVLPQQFESYNMYQHRHHRIASYSAASEIPLSAAVAGIPLSVAVAGIALGSERRKCEPYKEDQENSPDTSGTEILLLEKIHPDKSYQLAQHNRPALPLDKYCLWRPVPTDSWIVTRSNDCQFQ